MLKVLHVTSHFGGGVGRVLLNYLELAKNKSIFEHDIASLDYININAKNTLSSLKIYYLDNISKNYQMLIDNIPKYDIILIHWWNHPLMYEFLVKYSLPKCRAIFWSHISGLYAPSNFTEPLFKYADKFIFTTPISYSSEVFKTLSNIEKEKISVIWSTAGVDHTKNIVQKKHNGFNVGYLGTVDYSKLHNDFLDMSNKINIDNITFLVCGGEDEKNIEQEAINKKIHSKFKFLGKVNNIKPYLEIFDIFGYPLSSKHFGTCDQVLAEAMGCGIVPVVFNNPMEKSMVENNITGLIVNSQSEYIQAIELLHKDIKLRKKLSENAKKYALNSFSLNNMFNEWESCYKECLEIDPSEKCWKGKYQGALVSGFEIFYESLEKDYQKKFESFLHNSNSTNNNTVLKKILNTNAWKSKTKGTLNHYLHFFDDKILKEMSTLLKN